MMPDLPNVGMERDVEQFIVSPTRSRPLPHHAVPASPAGSSCGCSWPDACWVLEPLGLITKLRGENCVSAGLQRRDPLCWLLLPLPEPRAEAPVLPNESGSYLVAGSLSKLGGGRVPQSPRCHYLIMVCINPVILRGEPSGTLCSVGTLRCLIRVKSALFFPAVTEVHLLSRHESVCLMRQSLPPGASHPPLPIRGLPLNPIMICHWFELPFTRLHVD